MAYDDGEKGEADINPVDVLKRVEQQAATHKMLMIAVIAISGIIISVMATGMTVMLLRISALTEASRMVETGPFEQQFVALEQQLMSLANFRNSELKKIISYTTQLDKMASDCSLENIAPYRAFLLSRERDLQQLIAAIKSGSANLAAMSKGSKKWLDSHHKSLDNLEYLSVERQATLDKLVKRSSQ